MICKVYYYIVLKKIYIYYLKQTNKWKIVFRRLLEILNLKKINKNIYIYPFIIGSQFLYSFVDKVSSPYFQFFHNNCSIIKK